MSEESFGVPPAQGGSLPDMQHGALGEGDVHLSGSETAVHGTRVRALPEVQVLGRAVEIRGPGAQVVRDILEEWLDAQNRRITFLRRDGLGDSETRRQVRRILRRTEVVHRVLQAWEGVLALPQENEDS